MISFKIRGNTLAWISDYLKQRFIRVKFNKTLSDTYHLSQGVPQETVLSPTLFALYMTGIEKTVSPGTRVGMFADDIALWSSGRVIADIESRLNSSLKAMSKFADELKMSFNPVKSITTFFTTNKKLYNYHPSLMLKNQKLTYEKHPKYLGFILDAEFTCNKHIEYIASKARKRLNIIKYIAGRDWGADATTLKTSFQALIRPILEYGFPIYCCASVTNLNKLEKVQLSAARIITGLKRSCPSEIVLYEADLQPLSIRRQAGLVKYFYKLASIGRGNKTANYLNNWTCNQRLKKNSPFYQIKSQQLIAQKVEPHCLQSNLNTCDDLSNVRFQDGLLSTLSKKDCVPDLLRQLALEIINGIPPNDIVIYTDGSKMDIRAGSGIYIETPREKHFIKQRNPDYCSVFRSELIAIDMGLEKIMSESNYGDLWILSDSRSSIQHLKNWAQIGDKTSLTILRKVKLISHQHKVRFQWIPSHVDIYGNELADSLAKEGLDHPVPSASELTYLELFSRQKAQNREKWLIPPSHGWYKGKRPGLSLSLPCDRQSNTCLSRLASGHLKSLTYSGGSKRFPICPKCQQDQASPQHILDCLGLDWEDIHNSPLLVSDFIRVNGFIDLV